jgi:Domain of unknown function (DUF6532)
MVYFVAQNFTHCVVQDVKMQSGFAQHKIISEVLHEVWFNRKTAISIEFSDYFKPISLATMASIFAGVSDIFLSVYITLIFC